MNKFIEIVIISNSRRDNSFTLNKGITMLCSHVRIRYFCYMFREDVDGYKWKIV